MKFVFVLLNLIIFSGAVAQKKDKIAKPQIYRDHVVLYADHGFNSSPFSLHYPFTTEVNRIQFKHNLRPLIGIGIQHKWFGLRVGFSLKGHYRPVSRFGRSDYFDLGFRLNLKRTYWDFDFRNYRGYVIKDAYLWNDTLNALKPNLPMPAIYAANFSINTWYFRSKDYRMSAVLGINDEFTSSQETWYFKGTLNIFGAGNGSLPLVPFTAQDSTDGRGRVKTISALDFGVVPGYAYTFRKGNWQASAFGGLGGVIQAKWYVHDSITRGFMGIAPRIDLRFVGGYSSPRYFAWFVTDFDVKSIRFNKLSYLQTYYQLRIVAGMRIRGKKTKEINQQ